MSLMGGQETFIPSWPANYATQDDFNNVQKNVTPFLFPGTARSEPIKSPNVLVAIAALAVLVLLTHATLGGKKKR